MGFEYCLVDNWWDTQIGRDRIAELSKYAQSKGVHLLLWYNSNGFANDAPQGPRDCMNTAIAREREMKNAASSTISRAGTRAKSTSFV